MQTHYSIRAITIALTIGWSCAATGIQAQTPPAAPDAVAPAAKPTTLAADQAQLARDYAQIEELMLKLASHTAKTDPVRAQLLKQAFGQSKEKNLHGKLTDLSTLLGQSAFEDAIKEQKLVAADLKAILDVLQSEDRAKQLETESRRIRRYLEWLGKLIRQQEGVGGRTEAGDDLKRLVENQKDIAADTRRLRDDVRQHESSAEGPPDSNSPDSKPPQGKPDSPPQPSPGGKSDGKPDDQQPGGKPANGKSPGSPPKPKGAKEADQRPADDSPADNPVRRRLEQAEERMREAQEKLEKAQRDQAGEKQRKAVDELKQAQAELERILRQMREEQVERVLTMLEARFRKMLELQTAVYEVTVRLDKTPPPQRDRSHALEAGRQSVKEREIVALCDRALALLREDGSAAAMIEGAEQVHADMQQIADHLSAARVDRLTQVLEQDVLAALKEIVDALAAARQEHKDRPQPPPGSGPGEPGEQPLVDQLQELRMIRTLQWRINRRTQEFGRLIEGEQAQDPQLVQALRGLAERQKRLVDITRDIVTGKTE